jgi:hypothetical protein
MSFQVDVSVNENTPSCVLWNSVGSLVGSNVLEQYTSSTFRVDERSSIPRSKARGCQFSSTVTRRLQSHIRSCPREKEVALKPVEGYISFRPPLLLMSATPSTVPIPVATRSKSRVCGCSLAGIAGSNPARGMDVCLLCVCVCCVVCR